jgi:mannose-6-phosphate isomerase-like protein (cupin superfamily)
MSEVFFVHAGKGTMTVDEKEFEIKQGDCVSVVAGEHHEIRNTSENDLMLLYFGVLDGSSSEKKAS